MIEHKLRQIGLIHKGEAIELIKQANEDRSIIIDFDETLFLRNSTAEYLNSLKPRLIGLFLLKILYFIQPWNWLPVPFRGNKIRDWFLVTTATLLMPWTLFLWQKKAKSLADSYANQEIIDAVNNNANCSLVIASLGFNFIINPILKNMPIKYDRLISCRFWRGATDRSKNKLLMVKETLPSEAIASAVFITDSYDDMPLLQAVAKPCLVIWPLAKYVAPLNNIYLPFFYLDKVKRVGENYISRVILWDDVPVLLLAFSWQATQPLFHGISMLLLLVSFWCVYEIGYYENDLIAEKYEEKPKLSITYHTYKHTMETWHPWLWSIVFGLGGVWLLVASQNVNLLFSSEVIQSRWQISNPVLLAMIYWTGFLLLSRLCFWIYNYLNKQTRTWLYLLLQSFRYYGFIAVTAINPIGTSLLSSQIICRSILYIVYRYSGGSAENWPQQVPEKFLRWLIFIFILTAIAIGTRDFSLWCSWQTWTIFAWCLAQGQGQFIRIFRNIELVTQDGSNQVF